VATAPRQPGNGFVQTRNTQPMETGLRSENEPALDCALTGMLIREYRESDRFWAEPFMRDEFGGPLQARRGELLDVLALPGFVAERDGRPIGLVTYRLENDACELAFIASLERHAGVGTALLDAVVRAVAGCERIWLVTTNDNLEALRFYQRRGFVLSALRAGAVDKAREQLKSQIATVGDFGIRPRDELELELRPEARPGPGRR
jgi:ribosomal protein S18 acetylase RimI-like enzyme